MKYTQKIRNEIYELIRSDTYTVDEMCQLVGISRSTFFGWKKTKLDFLDLIKKADEERNEIILMEAKRSLLKRIRGYDVLETKITYDKKLNEKGEPVVKERVETKKHVPGDTTAIIFALTNRDPENWKRNVNSEGEEIEDMQKLEVTMRVLTKDKQDEIESN